MKPAKIGILPILTVLVLAPLAYADSAYALFVSGWPAEDPKQEAASVGSSLETGAYTASATASLLEARFRTWTESGGINLNTTEPVGFHLILR